jgi:tRNA U38,U39,U40 pseudouridine synthase TruA
MVTIDVRADAFLRGMARRIVAVLLAVGKRQLEASAVPRLLTAGSPALAGAAAPAQGLSLRKVVLGRPVALGRRHERGTKEIKAGHED